MQKISDRVRRIKRRQLELTRFHSESKWQLKILRALDGTEWRPYPLNTRQEFIAMAGLVTHYVVSRRLAANGTVEYKVRYD